jgi:hypothetical protein
VVFGWAAGICSDEECRESAPGLRAQEGFGMKSHTAPFPIAQAPWAIAGIVGTAIVLRCIGVTSQWLWLDELLAANWAVHGPWAAFVNILRFDLHPPLYYLQLSLWALASHDDVWLMANSIFWSTAAVVRLIYGVSKIYGLRAALYSGILLALAPIALAYADQVRMYTFIVFLIIWVWYTQERWLNETAGRFGALWMIASQTSVIYSHSAGLVMLSGCVLYGAARVLASGRRQAILRWLAIECLVGAVALPAIVIALFRGAGHTRTPDLTALIQTWGFLTFGMESALGMTLGALLLAALLVLAIYDKRTRLPLAMLVLMPLIVGAIISVFKPMWLPRVFLPTVPFICLVIGVGATAPDQQSGVRGGLRTSAFVLLATVWAGIGMFQQSTRQKGDGFKPAADLVPTIAHPGDTVLIDGDFLYWCFNWYYLGPDWGQPRHAYVLNADWARMMSRLPGATASFLGLNESDSRLPSGGTTVELWDRRIAQKSTADLIVVRQQGSALPMFSDRHLGSTAHLQQLIVERWTR